MMAGTLLIGLGQAVRQAWRAPHQAVLSLRLAWWLVLVSLLARVASLPRVQRLLSLRATSIRTTSTGSVWHHAGPHAAGRPAPEQLARAIDAILRLDLPILRRGRCWKRALVLQRFLARQGIDCRVTFGVRRTSNGVLQGHAWLERDGQPLLEPGTDTYAVTFSLAHADAASGARGAAGEGAIGAMASSEATSRSREMRLDLRPGGDREFGVLLQCARRACDRDRASALAASIAENGLDWDRLLRLARRNGLGPLLAWHLPRVCPSRIPGSVLDNLRDYERTHNAFSLFLTGELLRLLAALEAHGIEAVPFKGPALSAMLYGHVARRQFGDLDILVRPRDVWQASDVIAAHGFAPDTNIPMHRREALLRDDYARTFRRDDGRLLVELHWGIARRAYATPFETDRIWPRLTPLTLHGAHVATPSDEDLLLMLCVHGARHGWDQLERLASLAALLERADHSSSFDWEYVWRHARLMHAQRIVAFPLVLAAGLFERPLQAEAAAHMRSRSLQQLARAVAGDLHRDDAAPRTAARQALLHLQLKDGISDRARYCARTFLISTPDDWAAVPLSGPLAWSYPFVRAVRVARRYGFSQRFAKGE